MYMPHYLDLSRAEEPEPELEPGAMEPANFGGARAIKIFAGSSS